MLTVKYISQNRDAVVDLLSVRNFNDAAIIDQIISLDSERRAQLTKVEELKASLNRISRDIGEYFRQGKRDEADAAKDQTAKIKEEIRSLTADLNNIEEKLNELLVQVPNVPHESVPRGTGEENNVEVRSGGEFPGLGNNALAHWDLAKKYDIIDFDLGNKITGSGFPLYKGKGSRLQRALIEFFLDEASREGYTEYFPPLLVNEESGFATGQLPDKEGQMYHVSSDNLYLIPTAEVPLTNIFRGNILNSSDLPIKISAYTPCFRREAGSYGKDVKGLNRLHQFDKVEIVQVQHPDRSYDALEEMTSYVEYLLNKLELPYRIMLLCGGDMGFAAAKTYDFEVFSSAQERWLEVSSVSNFTSFQANRLKLRFREEGEKNSLLAHTLNGSALALPRLVAAMLENNQTSGGIKIPEVLLPYTGFEMIGQ